MIEPIYTLEGQKMMKVFKIPVTFQNTICYTGTQILMDSVDWNKY